jgi:murein DD-endopeptidase MepM/ murein hydrolase activator NlpD
MKIGKKTKIGLTIIASIFFLGFMLPERLAIPVLGATEKDWNHNTFWYEPWGKSGVHKGIDIFSPIGSPVISSTYGIVIFSGNLNIGGNVIVVLGPKWRVHYYGHLKHINVSIGSLVRTSEVIGTVGDSGNAKGKPSHLHYTILTLVPYLWRWDTSTQGWKKIFYLNPSKKLLGT